MAKAALVGGQSFLNPYEQLYNTVKQKELFNQQDWDYMAKRGGMGTYTSVLMDEKNPTPDDIRDTYRHYDNMDTEQRLSAIYNESHKDELSKNVEERTLSRWNEEKQDYEEYTQEMSDYDYTKYMLDQWADYEQYQIDNALIRDAQEAAKLVKDQNVVGNVFGTIASPFLEFFAGVTDFVSNVGQFFASIGSGIGSAATEGDFAKGFREAMENSYGRVEAFDAFSNWLVDFERNYSYVRNIDGTMDRGFGMYLTQTLRSIGQMVPSMIAGGVVGGVAGKAVGTAGKIIGGVSKVAASTVPYYLSMWNQRMYEKFSDPKFVDVDTYAIMSQTAIATALDASVDLISAKLFGATFFESKALGLTTKGLGKNASKVLSNGARGALRRLGKQFLVEGSEEAIQEFTEYFSEFCYSFAYEEFTNEEFGVQSMVDAFIMGGLGSLISAGTDIVVTGNYYIVGENGDIQRLNKLASWEAKANWGDLWGSFDKLLRRKDLTYDQQLDTLKLMYTSMVAFNEVYKNIGSERLTKADALLKKFDTRKRSYDDYIESNRADLDERAKTDKQVAKRLERYDARKAEGTSLSIAREQQYRDTAEALVKSTAESSFRNKRALKKIGLYKKDSISRWNNAVKEISQSVDEVVKNSNGSITVDDVTVTKDEADAFLDGLKSTTDEDKKTTKKQQEVAKQIEKESKERDKQRQKSREEAIIDAEKYKKMSDSERREYRKNLLKTLDKEEESSKRRDYKRYEDMTEEELRESRLRRAKAAREGARESVIKTEEQEIDADTQKRLKELKEKEVAKRKANDAAFESRKKALEDQSEREQWAKLRKAKEKELERRKAEPQSLKDVRKDVAVQEEQVVKEKKALKDDIEAQKIVETRIHQDTTQKMAETFTNVTDEEVKTAIRDAWLNEVYVVYADSLLNAYGIDYAQQGFYFFLFNKDFHDKVVQTDSDLAAALTEAAAKAIQSKQFSKLSANNQKNILKALSFVFDVKLNPSDHYIRIANDLRDAATQLDKAVEEGKISEDDSNIALSIINDTGKELIIEKNSQGTFKVTDTTITISENKFRALTADEIVEADTHQTIVNEMRRVLPTAIVKQITDVYRRVVNNNSIRAMERYGIDAESQAIYFLLFNSEFYSIFVNQATAEAINIVRSIDVFFKNSNKIKTALGQQLYKNALNQMRENMRKELREYYLAHYNEDFTNVKVFTKEDIEYIRQRTYLKDQFVKEVTGVVDATQNTIDLWNRLVNSLTVDKDGNIITAEKKAEYKNVFNLNYKTSKTAIFNEVNSALDYRMSSLENNIIYFNGKGDIGKTLFNKFAQNNNITLETVKNADTEAYNSLAFAFKNYTGGNYEFANVNGEFTIRETVEHIKVRNKVVDETLSKGAKQNFGVERDITNMKFVGIHRDNAVEFGFGDVLSDNLTDVEKATMTVDDVINNPRHYLNEETQAAIEQEYGGVVPESTFMYFQRKLDAADADVRLSRAFTGIYYLIDVADASTAMIPINEIRQKLRDADHNYTRLTVADFLRNDNFVPKDSPVRNVKIVIMPLTEGNAAYNSNSNIIIIPPEKIDTLSPKTLFHEVSHAIQNYNLTTGRGMYLPENFISNELYEDIVNHVTYLKKTRASLTERFQSQNIADFILRDSVRDLIYASSYEAEAFGTGYDLVIPFIIDKNMKLHTPWGTTWVLGGNSTTQAGSNAFAYSIDTAYTDEKLAENGVTDEVIQQKYSMPEGYKSRYVSNTEAMKSNLKYYIRRNEPIQIAQRVQQLIKGADRNTVDEGLWRLIFDAKLRTISDANAYFKRNYDSMNVETFKLFARFYGNRVIKSAKDLVALSTRANEIYGIVKVFEQLGASKFAEEVYTVDGIMKLINNVSENPKFAKVVAKYAKQFTEDIDASEMDFSVALMEKFDGTLYSLLQVSNSVARAKIEEKRHSKDKSLDSKIGGNKGDDKEQELIEKLDAQEAELRKSDRYDLPERDYTFEEMYQTVLDYDYANNVYPKIKDKNYSREQVRKILEKRARLINSKGPDFVEKYFYQIREKELLGKKPTKFRNVTEAKYAESHRDRKTIVAHMKSLATRIWNGLKPPEFKKLPEDVRLMFTEDGKLSEEYYKLELNEDETTKTKSENYEEYIKRITATEDRLKEIWFEVRQDYYSKTNKEIERLRQRNAELQEKLKELKAKKASRKKIVIKIDDVRTTIGQSTQDYPEILIKLMNTAFDKLSKKDVKMVSRPDEKQLRLSANEFYAKNANILADIDDATAHEIVNFFYNFVFVETMQTDTRRFKAYEVFILGYLQAAAQNGNISLSATDLEHIGEIFEKFASDSGSFLATWKTVLNKIRPTTTVINNMALSLGIDLSEKETEQLSEAIKRGSVQDIRAVYLQIYRKLREHGKQMNAENRGEALMNRLLRLHKAFMLSNVGTAIRNKISNFVLYYGNQAADFFGSIFKKLPGKFKNKEGQYDFTGIKVNTNDPLWKWLQAEVIDSGFIEVIEGGLTKYDVKENTDLEDDLIGLIKQSLLGRLRIERARFSKNFEKANLLDKMVELVFRMQGDDKMIRKQMMIYLYKIIKSENIHIDFTKHIEEAVDSVYDYPEGQYKSTTKKVKVDKTRIQRSRALLGKLAEAYSQAAIDFMRKPSFFSKLERELYKHHKGAYTIYKVLFPFMSAGWNWFMEAINWTPLGIVKGMIQTITLDKTITKYEDMRARGEYTPPTRFLQMVARRNMGKGVMGTMMMALGAILGAVGWIAWDDDDEKMVFKIGDLKIDISAITGTGGLFLGATLTHIWDENDGLSNVTAMAKKLIDLTLDELFLADFIQTVRYSGGTSSGYFEKALTNFINSLVPNLFRAVGKLVTFYDVKYESGVVGSLQRLAAGWIPGLANAYEKSIDIYTGEPIMKSIGNWFIEFIDQMTPLNLSLDVMSEQERLALALGVNKAELTGDYDYGKLNRTELNTKYGQLNKESLTSFINNQLKVEILDDTNKRVSKTYSQMTDAERGRAIKSLMQKNSTYAQVYVWTQVEGHKYYTSDSEYQALRKLGITKNVFRKTNSLEGFVN